MSCCIDVHLIFPTCLETDLGCSKDVDAKCLVIDRTRPMRWCEEHIDKGSAHATASE